MGVPKRQLCNNSLRVSTLGFGASPLGGVFGDVSEEVALQAVKRAFELGINYFDTSPFYGLTKSEELLGRCLLQLPRDEIVVSTKVGRYGDSSFDFSAERVWRSLQESLQRLRTDYLDIVLVHDVEFGDLEQIARETLPALAEAKAAGLVRHIGISGLPLAVLKRLVEIAPAGIIEVVLSYCHYCLNDTSLMTPEDPGSPDSAPSEFFLSRGISLINASPMAMGLLTRQGPPSWHPAPPALQEKSREAAAAASAAGFDIAALALKFSVGCPGAATTLVGMADLATVESNFKTVASAFASPSNADADADTSSAEARCLQEVLRILDPVKNVTWPSGRPLP